MNKTPIFIASFLKRYWKLLIVFVVLVLLSKVDQVTFFVGPVFYLAELAVASIVGALFIRHLFMRDTLDAFSQGGSDSIPSAFKQAWDGLDPSEKLKLSLLFLLGLFWGVAWIAASIAK